MIIKRKSLEAGFFSDIWNTISQGVPQAITQVIGEVSHSASTQIQNQLGITQQPPAQPPAITVAPSAPSIPVWVYVAGGVAGVLILKKVLKPAKAHA